MLEPLADLPPGVIGFEAVGEVEGSDYTGVLVPAIEAAAALGHLFGWMIPGDFKLFPLADRDAAVAWAAAD